MITTAKMDANSPGPVAVAREGVDVGANSAFSKLVPAETIERSAQSQYAQMLRDAADKNQLRPSSDAQVRRLRTIASKITPFAANWNARAGNWQWEINLIDSKQINAFCMPGGKIAFYSGILDQLRLTDDEVAMVMGHEIAHALREHARERLGKNAATSKGAPPQWLSTHPSGQTRIAEMEKNLPRVMPIYQRASER